MEKIKFITDTACDIPLSTAFAQGVEEAPLTVTVLGDRKSTRLNSSHE